MIYLFTGDDSKSKLGAYEKFISSLPKSTGTFFITRNDFDPMQIESLYSGASLFASLNVVIFKDIFEYEEKRDFIIDTLTFMEKSGNIFVFVEGKLSKPIIDAFKKATSEKSRISVFDLPKENKQKKEKFDTFSIANAFAGKDKLHTWIYFREAIEQGIALEEIAGVLFWKLKDMILRKNFATFSEQELAALIARISYLLPEARRKGADAETTFEQFLLEVF